MNTLTNELYTVLTAYCLQSQPIYGSPLLVAYYFADSRCIVYF